MICIDPTNIKSMRPARRHAEITQKDLASEIGISQAYLCEIEKGKADPKLSTWLRIVSVIEARLNGEAAHG